MVGKRSNLTTAHIFQMGGKFNHQPVWYMNVNSRAPCSCLKDDSNSSWFDRFGVKSQGLLTPVCRGESNLLLGWHGQYVLSPASGSWQFNVSAQTGLSSEYLEDHPRTCKWLITMVIVNPLSRVVPLPNGLLWLINGGDPSHLQVRGWSSKYVMWISSLRSGDTMILSSKWTRSSFFRDVCGRSHNTPPQTSDDWKQGKTGNTSI